MPEPEENVLSDYDDLYRKVGYIYNRHYRKRGRAKRYLPLSKEIVNWYSENYKVPKQVAIRAVAKDSNLGRL